jgi:hypothetical protein
VNDHQLCDKEIHKTAAQVCRNSRLPWVQNSLKGGRSNGGKKLLNTLHAEYIFPTFVNHQG